MGIFGNAFGWPHLIVILVVVLLLFGATKLPALSKSIGQSIKIFRKEIKSETTGAPDGSAASEADSGSAKPADTPSADKP